jgi:hypothetical protein
VDKDICFSELNHGGGKGQILDSFPKAVSGA